jgi:hypothetical protein
MIDSFQLLNEPRRPWLDVEQLRQRFLQLSAGEHPDRFHGAGETEKVQSARHYTDLNTAYQVLRDPRARLLHLLELETGSRPRDIQRIPGGTMDLFVEIGQACRDVDAFLLERSRVTSPMLRVRVFQQGLDWVGRLKALREQVKAKAEGLEDGLRLLNEDWETAPPPGDPARAAALPLGRLEELYRALSYVSRWTGQIEERLAQLAGA